MHVAQVHVTLALTEAFGFLPVTVQSFGCRVEGDVRDFEVVLVIPTLRW